MNGPGSTGVGGRSTSSSSLSAEDAHVLQGRPFKGVKMHIGSGSSTSSSKGPQQHHPQHQQQQQQPPLGKQPSQRSSGNSSTGCQVEGSSSSSQGAPAGPTGVQLHVGELSLIDDLLAGAQYSQAAYGYVAAAGHLSNLGNAIKMLATLPHFNAITGEQSKTGCRCCWLGCLQQLSEAPACRWQQLWGHVHGQLAAGSRRMVVGKKMPCCPLRCPHSILPPAGCALTLL
jgi:hypothetical protein